MTKTMDMIIGWVFSMIFLQLWGNKRNFLVWAELLQHESYINPIKQIKILKSFSEKFVFRFAEHSILKMLDVQSN